MGDGQGRKGAAEARSAKRVVRVSKKAGGASARPAAAGKGKADGTGKTTAKATGKTMAKRSPGPPLRAPAMPPGAGGAAPARSPGTMKAMFQSTRGDGAVKCSLCHHECVLKPGKAGICRVRKNIDGTLHSTIYGLASAVNVDPIEKKPFFHFKPGTRILSYGSVGCNFRCRYCQNHSISQTEADTRKLKDQGPPEQPARRAKEMGCKGIAWTYNEPTVWYEYAYDASKVAKKEGLWVVFVSNGYLKEAPLRKIAPYLDAINVDIKGFDKERFKKTSGAKLDRVLETCTLVRELDIHLEISYLVIPTHNDGKEEISRFCRWVVDELGPDTPVHFLRFHPDYKWTNIPPTSLPSLLNAYRLALKEGLNFPYVGNIPNEGYEDTRCPECDSPVIERRGHSVVASRIGSGKCPDCGAELAIIL